MIITVQDINDHSPFFDASNYFVNVSESIDIDDLVVTVIAMDRDVVS